MHKITNSAIALMLLAAATGARAASYTLQDYPVFPSSNFSSPDGSNPIGGLTVLNGTLYGTASEGGADAAGTLFSYTPGTSSVTKLTDFTGYGTGTTGADPSAGLTDVDGTLYGTTSEGGAGYAGTLFSYSPTAGFASLASFSNAATGGEPLSALTDVGGTLYGTTDHGGTNNDGEVFSYSSTAGLQGLASFTGTTGTTPDDGLTYDPNDSTFYGIDSNGLYSYTAATGITDISPLTGRQTFAGLTLVGGTLYGVTNNSGELFSYTPGAASVTNLAPAPGNPVATLLNVDGTLYGTTLNGGTVFSYTPGAASVTTVATLSGGNASFPMSDLTDVNGTLYGTAEGGPIHNGEVFALVPATAAVPEPPPTALLVLGLAPAGGLILRARRRAASRS